jgi:hypothetical protein
MIVIDGPELSVRLDECSLAIARFLATQQSADGHFAASDLYGRAFSALLWSRCGSEFARPISRSIRTIVDEQARPLPANYHFEFIRYALIKLFVGRPDLGEIKDVLPRELYRGTRVANWTLLRAFCRFHSVSRIERAKAATEVAVVRRWFSDKSGLIEDQKGAYTMQYHAFCTALLGELLAGPMKDSASTRHWFGRSIDAFSDLVLPGGQCNYIGRGSLQTFGYAAGMLALAHGCRNLERGCYWEKAVQILALIEGHQDKDGSLPLVLRDIPEGKPETFDLKDPGYAGWWSYNNYYDYLPFTGAMLRLAAEIFSVCRFSYAKEQVRPIRTKRLGASIVKVERQSYTAVFTLPNRKLWAASVPVPYMETAGNYPFPCYGGEQQGESIYSERGVPLPIVLLQNDKNIVFSRFRYRWVGPSSFSTGGGGFSHVRQFIFNSQEIIIRDNVAWRNGAAVQRVKMLRVLLPQARVLARSPNTVVLQGLILEFSGQVQEENERHYSANGPLTCFYTAPDVLGETSNISAQVVIRMSLRDKQQDAVQTYEHA